MRKILIVLFISGTFIARAQTPQLVADLIPGVVGSGPAWLTVFNGKLYFAATELATGTELYVYDGVNPPSLVFDINPGPDGSLTGFQDDNMCIYNNRLYFSGNNGTNGSELMFYDGVNPPALGFDISGGSGSSDPKRMLAYDGKLYFNAYTSQPGAEFRVYDGTNTPSVFDINVGSPSNNANPLIEYNGKIYFSATNTVDGYELCSYNPATHTLIQIDNLSPGSSSSSPRGMMVHNGKLYLTASTPTYGRELYSYDGTNLIRLTDLAPGADDGASGLHMVEYGGYIYFSGSPTGIDFQLYKYNLTNGLVSLAHTVNPTGNASVARFIKYANKLYFTASDGVSGQEVWVHDGTNTSMVQDLNPGAGGTFFDNMCVYNGKLFFAATTPDLGTELYSLTDPAAGIKNIWLNGDVTIAPNPTSGNTTLQLSLKNESELNVTITDITGKLIWEEATTSYPTGNTNVVLPLLEQTSGTYFYSVKDNSGRTMASGKLQKQ